MNAAETIKAAIEKLEALRGDDVWQIGVVPDEVVSEHLTMVADAWSAAEADLIVTLHRTIDAQLAILRLHLDLLTNPDYDREEGDDFESNYSDIMALAHAILGGTS